jgi:hypothetical protein
MKIGIPIPKSNYIDLYVKEIDFNIYSKDRRKNEITDAWYYLAHNVFINKLKNGENMTTRISYTKTVSTGKIVTKEAFVAGTKLVKASIELVGNNFEVVIFEPETFAQVFNTSTTTIQSAKKAVKNMLKEIGVVFGDEARTRKPKIDAVVVG